MTKAPLICLIGAAIKATKKGGNKGVSRASIANYIISNYNKKAGGAFNARLRKALKNLG